MLRSALACEFVLPLHSSKDVSVEGLGS